MHHDFIDRYSRLDSPVHRVPATIKVAGGSIMVLVSVASPIAAVYPFVIIAGILLFAVALSAIPAGFIIRRILLFEPFILTVAALALLQPDGATIFASVVVKSTLSLTTLTLLSNTTPFSQLLDVLRRVRVPSLIVTLLALMYRYLFILIDEIERMKIARVSRTFTRKGARKWGFRAAILGQLFVRASERAEQVYAAMCARGWK